MNINLEQDHRGWYRWKVTGNGETLAERDYTPNGGVLDHLEDIQVAVAELLTKGRE